MTSFTIGIKVVSTTETEMLDAVNYFQTTFGTKVKAAYGNTTDLTLNVSLEEANYADLVTTMTTLRAQYPTAPMTFGS